MAMETSRLWKELRREKGTQREYAFEIDGRRYGAESEIGHSVERELFEEFGFGNAAAATLKLRLLAESIPRGAEIRRFVRLKNGERVSEWLPAGVFFVNRRSEEDGVWTLEAFDAMRKAERVWEPRQDIRFPLAMPEAAEEFARLMGCAIDPRTRLDPAYTIDYPANDYTMRQELQFIAAAHGGNWIVTGEGKLLLLPLGGEPEETYWLVDERGEAITLGGVRLKIG